MGEGDLMTGVQIREARRRASDEKIRVLFGKAEFARNRYREIRFCSKRRAIAKRKSFSVATTMPSPSGYEVPKQPGMES